MSCLGVVSHLFLFFKNIRTFVHNKVITETEWKHVPEDSMVELASNQRFVAYEDWFNFYPSWHASALLILPA